MRLPFNQTLQTRPQPPRIASQLTLLDSIGLDDSIGLTEAYEALGLQKPERSETSSPVQPQSRPISGEFNFEDLFNREEDDEGQLPPGLESRDLAWLDDSIGIPAEEVYAAPNTSTQSCLEVEVSAMSRVSGSSLELSATVPATTPKDIFRPRLSSTASQISDISILSGSSTSSESSQRSTASQREVRLAKLKAHEEKGGLVTRLDGPSDDLSSTRLVSTASTVSTKKSVTIRVDDDIQASAAPAPVSTSAKQEAQVKVVPEKKSLFTRFKSWVSNVLGIKQKTPIVVAAPIVSVKRKTAVDRALERQQRLAHIETLPKVKQSLAEAAVITEQTQRISAQLKAEAPELFGMIGTFSTNKWTPLGQEQDQLTIQQRFRLSDLLHHYRTHYALNFSDFSVTHYMGWVDAGDVSGRTAAAATSGLLYVFTQPVSDDQGNALTSKGSKFLALDPLEHPRVLSESGVVQQYLEEGYNVAFVQWQTKPLSDAVVADVMDKSIKAVIELSRGKPVDIDPGLSQGKLSTWV